jgi:hypothetical protein
MLFFSRSHLEEMSLRQVKVTLDALRITVFGETQAQPGAQDYLVPTDVLHQAVTHGIAGQDRVQYFHSSVHGVVIRC